VKALSLSAVLIALSMAHSFAGFMPHVLNDRDFVALSWNRGYYMISSDSGKWWHWGLVRAPVEEPRMFTHGFGDDAIAIPFDARGRVTFAPVYIYTITPEDYERQRLAALFEGLSTKADVRLLLVDPRSKAAFVAMRYGISRSASTTRLKIIPAVVGIEGRFPFKLGEQKIRKFVVTSFNAFGPVPLFVACRWPPCP
jgi:hypothetical protein